MPLFGQDLAHVEQDKLEVDLLIISMELHRLDVVLVLTQYQRMSFSPLPEYLRPQSPIGERGRTKLSVDSFFLAPEIVSGQYHLIPCLFDQYLVLDPVDSFCSIEPTLSYFLFGLAVHVHDHFAELGRLLARPCRRQRWLLVVLFVHDDLDVAVGTSAHFGYLVNLAIGELDFVALRDQRVLLHRKGPLQYFAMVNRITAFAHLDGAIL